MPCSESTVALREPNIKIRFPSTSVHNILAFDRHILSGSFADTQEHICDIHANHETNPAQVLPDKQQI